MPSERFDRLAPEKKKRILEAALREFSEQPVALASINQIVKDAGISRGSIYTYFEDKADLLQWVLCQYAEEFEHLILEQFRTVGGDPFLCADYLYVLCRDRLKEDSTLSFLKHMVSDPEFMQKAVPDPALGIRTDFHKKVCRILSELMDCLDRERYDVDEESFYVLFPLIVMLVVRTAALAAEFPEREDHHHGTLVRQLKLLKYGALRRDVEKTGT